jgi:protein SCO1/2
MLNAGRWTFITHHSSLIALVVVGILASPALAQLPPPKITPPDKVVKEIRIEQNLGAQVPLDVPFRDESGNAVTLRDYFGKKPVILSLVYYQCPQLCNMSLNGMLAAFKALSPTIGSDFQVVTVSFDPSETPDLARAKKDTYLGQYDRAGAENGWHFLTGDAEPIAKLTETVGFRYFYDPRTKQYAHGSAIMLLTPDGKVSRYFYGIEFSARDINLGLVEASDGKIGTLAEKVMLLCYQYDPRSGKYGFAIVAALRTGAVITVLSLCTFWFVMYRRERRLRAAPAIEGHRQDLSFKPRTPNPEP